MVYNININKEVYLIPHGSSLSGMHEMSPCCLDWLKVAGLLLKYMFWKQPNIIYAGLKFMNPHLWTNTSGHLDLCLMFPRIQHIGFTTWRLYIAIDQKEPREIFVNGTCIHSVYVVLHSSAFIGESKSVIFNRMSCSKCPVHDYTY